MKKEELLNQANCVCDELNRMINDLWNEGYYEQSKLAKDALTIVERIVSEI